MTLTGQTHGRGGRRRGTAATDHRTAAARQGGTLPGGEARADRFALTAVCLGFFMVLIDGSALNVALPAVQRDVHGSIAGLQWVVNVYTIPLAGVLLSAGTIADRLGARRLFVWSLTGFTVASLLCAVSPSLDTLIAARALQGVAAGGVLPTTLAILVRTYPDPIERARAITVWGTVGALALTAGPVSGGVLSDVFGWRSIFLINVPVGAVTLYLARRYARETSRREGRSFDLPGQFTGVLALTTLVAWLITGGSSGWWSTVTLVLLTAAVVSSAGFLWIETTRRQPMLPLAVFRRPAFSASVVNGFAFQFGGYGLQFVLALYLQQRWHLSAAGTGLLFLPFGVSWVVGTIVINRRLLHRGPRWLLWTGATSSLAGSLICLGVTDRATWPVLVLGTMLVGMGCGVFSPSLNAAAMLSIDAEYAGLGSAVFNTARQVGMAVGVALLGAFIVLPDAVTGLRVDLALVAVCFLAIVVLSLRYAPRHELARPAVPGSGPVGPAGRLAG